MTYNFKYEEYRKTFENYLNEYCSKLYCEPKILLESVKYSLQLGGKRIRPVLMLAVGDFLGLKAEKLLNYALALELIHTYSLIHDDLPDMDNDDFRRGKPSNHKVFGNANALLAGDALLNSAYAILINECKNGVEYISAASYINECAGIHGMIGGQSADLLHENDNDVNEATLDFIYENKTSKLIMAAVVTPSILAGGKYFPELTVFGRDLGYLFQLTDDILDVEGSFQTLGKTTGKDSEEGKYTAIKLFGLDASKVKADLLCGNLQKLLESFDGDTEFLKEFVNFVRKRIN